MSKKIISTILALFLILTTVPAAGISASAAEDDTANQLPSSLDLRN